MTSFLIVTKDTHKQQKIVSEICEQHAVDPFDKTVIAPEKELSLGIELVKKLQEKVFLKPLKSKTKAVIIAQAHLLTIPAQNALLKLLEEPPEHTLVFLLTESLDALLPTVRSRCTIITSKEKLPFILSKAEKQRLQDMVSEWRKNTIGRSLKLAEQLAKDKSETLQLLQKMIIAERENLFTHPSENQAHILMSLQETYKVLKTTNTNPRLALENLFFKLRMV